MNEKASAMMNQHQHQQQMMNMNQNPQMMSMNQHQPQQQVTKPLKHTFLNPNLTSTINSNSRVIGKGDYLKHPKFNNNPQMMLNQPPQQMINRSYGMWPPPLPVPDQLKYQNPNPNVMGPPGGGFVSGKQQHQGVKPLGPRSNWKGKRVNDKRKDGRRKENIGMSLMAGTSSGLGGVTAGGGGVGIAGGGYKPPMLKELQQQNRVKARRFFTKKKFNNYNYSNNNNGGNNVGKFAPRNTSSFIIRAKKSGGIADLVSPCQGTPAVLPTPIFSPSREVLVDMAKEEWGVDGYGSMKGLIRLRSPGRDDEVHDGEEEEDEGGSSESDVEEHVEVERRLDHDLSRFEMIYPNYAGGVDYNNVLENRVDDQDTHIAQLEEENLILKERLFLMERELGDLRRRMQFLERRSRGAGEEINEEVVENESENDSESREEAHSMEENEDFVGDNTEGYENMLGNEHKDVDDDLKAAIDDQYENMLGKEETKDVDEDVKASMDDQCVADVKGKEDKNGSSDAKDESEDVEVKEENNEEKVRDEEQNNEINTGMQESAAVADDPMDEVPQADNNSTEENQAKDEAAGNEGVKKSISGS